MKLLQEQELKNKELKLEEQLRLEKEAEEMFNFEEYFKSSDMFTGVPPVYKRILNTLLNFDNNLLDRHDFNTSTI